VYCFECRLVSRVVSTYFTWIYIGKHKGVTWLLSQPPFCLRCLCQKHSWGWALKWCHYHEQIPGGDTESTCLSCACFEWATNLDRSVIQPSRTTLWDWHYQSITEQKRSNSKAQIPLARRHRLFSNTYVCTKAMLSQVSQMCIPIVKFFQAWTTTDRTCAI
jgi:hypothetical protein